MNSLTLSHKEAVQKLISCYHHFESSGQKENDEHHALTYGKVISVLTYYVTTAYRKHRGRTPHIQYVQHEGKMLAQCSS